VLFASSFLIEPFSSYLLFSRLHGNLFLRSKPLDNGFFARCCQLPQLFSTLAVIYAYLKLFAHKFAWDRIRLTKCTNSLKALHELLTPCGQLQFWLNSYWWVRYEWMRYSAWQTTWAPLIFFLLSKLSWHFWFLWLFFEAISKTTCGSA